MDLRMYLNVLRKRWRVVAATVAVLLVLVGGYTAVATKSYASSVQFFVSTADSSDASQLAQGSTFSQARVTSYTQLVTAPVVLQPVIDTLQLSVDAKTLGKQITASVPPNTVLIDVSVTDKDSQQARRIAEAIGQQFPQTVQSIERVSAGSASPVKITLTKGAVAEPDPVAPRVLLNLLLALVLGLILGLVLAVARHALDNRVRTKEDLEKLSDALTVIGTIPFDADASKHPLLMANDMHSGRSEAFRSLRTNLQFIDVENHPRVVVMTSSLAGEGKTTTTANLALVLAELGSSVCIIEGDLRRPRLLDYLGMEGAVGLTDVLIKRATLDDVLQPFGKSHLSVIGAGELPPNPSELLGSPAMRSVLDQLQQRFDYVIVDAPPLLPVTDAAVLSALASGAVLVVGSGLVTRDDVRTAMDSLESASGHLLGVALNRVPRSKRSNDYHGYRYKQSTSSSATAHVPDRASGSVLGQASERTPER